ncbi:MAG: hypothetical protein U1E60_19210 [Reyranellaceae bacterium]
MDHREATCPACGLHIATPFFDGGLQPLATLSWPASASAAQALPRLPLDFVRCIDCGHVYNTAFDYAQVPYSEKPNLMFNRATNWSRFVGEAQQRMLDHLPDRPVVVEIGHGDGGFLEALAARRPGGRYVGFDPHGSTRSGNGAELRAEYFTAARHLAELRPHMVVSRHVLEHLSNPLAFLQGLSFAAASLDLATLAYFEVPCIDQAIETRRTVDFYYEHSSQFTTESFTRMLRRTAAELIEVEHGYGREVIFGFVRLGTPASALHFARDSEDFAAAAAAARQRISDQVAELHRRGKRIAVWGGTGKSAAFICRYGLDRERFPVVVDSDPAKAGTFVPGTGQEIHLRDHLLAHPVDIVIIPPQWRAADIVLEMHQAGIAVESVLIEHDGQLIDFHRAPHPYRQ